MSQNQGANLQFVIVAMALSQVSQVNLQTFLAVSLRIS